MAQTASIEESGSSSEAANVFVDELRSGLTVLRSIESSGSSTAAPVLGLGLSSVGMRSSQAEVTNNQPPRQEHRRSESLGREEADDSMEGTSSDYGQPHHADLDDMEMELHQDSRSSVSDAVGSMCSALWIFVAVLVLSGLCVAALVRWWAPGEPEVTIHFALFLTILTSALTFSACAAICIVIGVQRQTILHLIEYIRSRQ